MLIACLPRAWRSSFATVNARDFTATEHPRMARHARACDINYMRCMRRWIAETTPRSGTPFSADSVEHA
eukprot:1480990-Pyramimonas_sp.AAC.1